MTLQVALIKALAVDEKARPSVPVAQKMADTWRWGKATADVKTPKWAK